MSGRPAAAAQSLAIAKALLDYQVARRREQKLDSDGKDKDRAFARAHDAWRQLMRCTTDAPGEALALFQLWVTDDQLGHRAGDVVTDDDVAFLRMVCATLERQAGKADEQPVHGPAPAGRSAPGDLRQRWLELERLVDSAERGARGLLGLAIGGEAQPDDLASDGFLFMAERLVDTVDELARLYRAPVDERQPRGGLGS